MTKEEYMKKQQEMAKKYFIRMEGHFHVYEAIEIYDDSETVCTECSRGIKDMLPYYGHIQPGWHVEAFEKDYKGAYFTFKVVDVSYSTTFGVILTSEYGDELWSDEYWFGVMGIL